MFRKGFFGNCSGGVRGASVGNFRGGRKPFPKPSAFESEIHPTHKPSVYASGISPCRGQIHSGVNLSIAAQRTGAWMELLLTATFQSRCEAMFCGGLSAVERREASNEKEFIYRNGKAA